METVIVVLQILCVAGLTLGTELSLYPLMRGSNERFSYTVANDFETGLRRRLGRLVRNRR